MLGCRVNFSTVSGTLWTRQQQGAFPAREAVRGRAGDARVSPGTPNARPCAGAFGSLSPAKHADEKIKSPYTGLGICGWILVVFSFLFTLVTFPLSIWLCIKIIKEYERAIIFRLGRILQGGAKGPGLFFVLPCTDNFIKVDMRTISFDIPPQEILTKDSVTISVDGVVYYRVQNATLAVANITNADSATRLLAQTTLRNVLGTKNLSQILSDREEIAHNMQTTLDDATDEWGIKVERVEIKDVKLPVQLQRAMAAEAEASREARAKVIAAEGEMNASRALKEASMVITESPAALQLRYLQTLTTIAAEKNSTIVFPLPIDMLQGIMGAKH
ncbi:stomatin isoform X1 [Desmodus rotundus]|uniref:stomatin isoform X1 n=1 Tax=Desmodus rotundus TaxID=9430 RepID=UPI002380D0FC|nr:stomatin isoform X1 [Desmodus rotundus]